MSESTVEKPTPRDYPPDMETRVAILEHSTAELKFEIREVKAMVRDLTNTVLAKFAATDKAISDLRVDVQSVRTEIQSVRTDLERGLRDNLWKTVVWFGAMISITGTVITILVKLPHF